MHGDSFEVDAERLAARASQFEPLVGRLGEIHRTLSDALSADGTCWGTDAVGRSFGSVHATPVDNAMTNLSALPDRLTSVSTRLAETAGTYQAGERSAVENLKAAEQ